MSRHARARLGVSRPFASRARSHHVSRETRSPSSVSATGGAAPQRRAAARSLSFRGTPPLPPSRSGDVAHCHLPRRPAHYRPRGGKKRRKKQQQQQNNNNNNNNNNRRSWRHISYLGINLYIYRCVVSLCRRARDLMPLLTPPPLLCIAVLARVRRHRALPNDRLLHPVLRPRLVLRRQGIISWSF